MLWSYGVAGRLLLFSLFCSLLSCRLGCSVFMLLAIVGVILWTQLEESRNIAYIVLIVGVVLKIAEVCIRLFKK